MKNFKNSNSDSPTHHSDSPTPEPGSRRLSDSPSRGVSDFPTGSRWLSEFSFKHSKADSPTRRIGESATPRLGELESHPLPDSTSRGVVFWLRISPRFRSKNRNSSKGSVRDLWGTNFCKNPRKSASLPCPFKSHIERLCDLLVPAEIDLRETIMAGINFMDTKAYVSFSWK